MNNCLKSLADPTNRESVDRNPPNPPERKFERDMPSNNSRDNNQPPTHNPTIIEGQVVMQEAQVDIQEGRVVMEAEEGMTMMMMIGAMVTTAVKMVMTEMG